MQPSHQSLRISVDDGSAVGQARRAAVSMAQVLGLDETRRGALAVITTEACTNVLQHARQGEVLIRPVVEHTVGVELLAVDRGPGIHDLALALSDGYSTGGSRGVGLGSIRRMSDTFDLYSGPAHGTVLLARVMAKGPTRPNQSRALDVGVVCAPYPGEEVCGDAWVVEEAGERTVVLVVDGLGHGPLACEAAMLAVEVVQDEPARSPSRLLAALNDALRPTRGAAGAVASIDWSAGELSFAGVGNIAGCIDGARRRQNLTSHNGILGQGQPRMQEFSYPFDEDAVLLLHSDGISTRWDLDAYAGISARHPSLIAAVLYRDFGRQRDDATVVVVRRGEDAGGAATGEDR